MRSSYLITGATGYVGAIVSKTLLKEGQNVTVVIRSPHKLDPDIQREADVILADMTNRETIAGIRGQYDYIIHCAAPTKSAWNMNKDILM